MRVAIVSWRCRQEPARPCLCCLSLLRTSSICRRSENSSTALVSSPRGVSPITDGAMLTWLAGTMSEIEKALVELQSLMKYRAEQLGYEEEFRGLGLTSRKNLCLHPSVKREKSGSVVDARCRSLTAGFVKEKKDRGENVDVCVYHDVCPSLSLARRVDSPKLTLSRIWISLNPIT